MSDRAVSAGQRLRLEMDEALRRASKEASQPEDQPLEWTEQEIVALDAACAAADRSEALSRMFRTEMRRKVRVPALLVKLSGEIRALDRQVVDLLAKVNPGLETPVSVRHQQAARGRWGDVPRPKGVRS